MPPRFVYWTILIDDKPTAFRAQYKEDLQPTFVQLQRTNPNAVMRWFARGKLWDNPEQAQWAARNMGEAREKRTREWRPGGEHKDPRARFDKKRKPAGAVQGFRPAKPSGVGRVFRPAGKDSGKPPWRPKPSGVGRAPTGVGRVFRPAGKDSGKPPWRPKPSGVGQVFRPARPADKNRPASKDNRGRKR